MSKRATQKPHPRTPGPSAHTEAAIDRRLARLLDTPHLARLVPYVPPETLHQIIRYRGLEACGELVAAATPEQLVRIFDLDLWRSARPGGDEQFDEERFGEWLEVLVETDPAFAAQAVAAMDPNLVIAGLSRHVSVFDPAAAATPVPSSDDEPMEMREMDGLTSRIGGYMVRARRNDGWDAIVALLLALDADHPACFHTVMRGCRNLSNGEREIDGLDDLLHAPEQLLHDVALAREHRRTEQGYATAADARAFLTMARGSRPCPDSQSPAINPIAAAYFRSVEEEIEPPNELPPDADARASIDAVADLILATNAAGERPRALLEGTAPQSGRPTRLHVLMERARDVDEAAYLTRHRELAFLSNTLMSGCSLAERAFTPQEAVDAAASTCNLGLERTPDADAPSDDWLVDHDLVEAFEVGWRTLHRDVALFAADGLIGVLANLHSVDADVESGLKRLRRELKRQRASGTPWLAGDALEVIAMLDTPAWASLRGLLAECPVLPAALRATLLRQTRSVSATAFEFISTTAQLDEVRAFMTSLRDLLVG